MGDENTELVSTEDVLASKQATGKMKAQPNNKYAMLVIMFKELSRGLTS